MLQSVAKCKIGDLFHVPPIVVMLCQRSETGKFDLSGLRAVMSSAAPLSNERFKWLMVLLPQVIVLQCYSLDKAGMIGMGTNGEQSNKPRVSASVPLPGVTKRADGSCPGFDEPEALTVKIHSMASGYANNENVPRKASSAVGFVLAARSQIISKRRCMSAVSRPSLQGWRPT